MTSEQLLISLNGIDLCLAHSHKLIDTQISNLLRTTFNCNSYLDMIKLIQFSKTVGLFSILIQLITGEYVLYDTIADIKQHRKLSNKLLDVLLNCYKSNIYSNIDHLFTFISYNRTYFCSYHNQSNRGFYQKVATFLISICNDLRQCFCSKLSKHVSGNPIKIGFISDILTNGSSVAKDRLGIIKSLYNDHNFDVKIITRNEINSIDHFFKTIVFDNKFDSIFMDINGSLSNNRHQIQSEHFDILVFPEIGMCQKNRLLAFSRCAPIQITTWGHSDTSGLPEIDYYVSSKYFNDQTDDEYFSEKLILLDSIGTYYYNLPKILNIVDIDVSDIIGEFNKFASNINVQNPHFYGCMQTYFKLHPSFIDMLSDLLTKDKSAILIMLVNSRNPEIVNYINRHLKTDRIMIVYSLEYAKFCKHLKAVDILLDYYPFGGFNSTMESFAMGKIVITRTSRWISGRFTTGLYQKMNMDEFITKNKSDYINKAIEYASNIEKRLKFEQIIKSKSDCLFCDNDSINDWKKFLTSLC